MKVQVIGKIYLPEMILEDGMIGKVTEEFDTFVVAEFNGVGIPFERNEEGVLFYYVD